VPANATIALAGDFDPADAKAKIAKWFGSLPKSTKPKVVPIPAPAVASRRIEVPDGFAKLGQITWAWHAPAAFAADDAELAIAADALTREGTGRLWRVLVHDRQLAQKVDASQDGMGFSGVFSLTVQLRSNADVATVEALVADELAKVRAENLSDREVAQVVARKEASLTYSLESLMRRASLLQQYDHYLGNPGSIGWDLDRFRTTTPDKIRAAIATWLSPDHVIEVVTVPKGGTK
jgi:zinc protease